MVEWTPPLALAKLPTTAPAVVRMTYPPGQTLDARS
jgi:hypothetical protein